MNYLQNKKKLSFETNRLTNIFFCSAIYLFYYRKSSHSVRPRPSHKHKYQFPFNYAAKYKIKQKLPIALQLLLFCVLFVKNNELKLPQDIYNK